MHCAPYCASRVAKLEGLNRKTNMSGGDWKELFNAGCEGDLALVKYHVTAGVDVNYAHPEFLSTPLVAAILAKQEQVALFLLAHGALPNLHSEFDGVTPVQAAKSVGLTVVEARRYELGVPREQKPASRVGWLGRLFGRTGA